MLLPRVLLGLTLAAAAAAAPVEGPVALRESFVSSVVAFRPEAATSLGLPGSNGRLGLPTPQNIAAQVAYFEGVERQLGKAGPAAEAQAEIDRQVMLTVARSQLHELRDRKSYLTDVGAAQGPYEVIQAQVAQKGDWADIAARAAQIPAYLAAVRANLERGAAEGRQVYRGFVEKDGIEAANAAAEFFDSVKLPDAARAYREHAAFLQKEIQPRATEAYGLGAEEYAWKLKNELGLSRTPSELQQHGRELAQKITARMETLAAQIDPSRPLPDLMASLRADHPKDDVQLMDTYRQVSSRARDFVVQHGLFAIPPDYSIEVIETPAGMRSSIGSAAYFPAPPLEPGKKGVFLVTPSGGDEKRLQVHNFAKIPTTVVHEAFPGHDMQFWSFQRAREISPVRYLLDQAGYAYSLNVEGYAHYAEELMRARGFFTPKEELAQLGAQLWRAYRISLDASLHLGELDMAGVARTLAEKAFLPQAIAAVEAYRYAKMPTQALTYALGRLEIEALKDDYRTLKGDAYDEQEFHREFLSYGPVLPSMIRAAMLRAPQPAPRGRPLLQVAAWVAAAAVFNLGLFLKMGAAPAQQFWSAYLIEWTMSLDNMAVIAATLSAVPAALRPRVLRWGLIGTIAARLVMITAGVGLVAAHHALFYAFGAFLIATAAKLLKPEWDVTAYLLRPMTALWKKLRGGRAATPERPKSTRAFAVRAALGIVGIGIVFALDSVPAALAVSKSAFVIFSANAFSVMGLGALLAVVERLEKKLTLLPKGIAAVLLFVGAKMIAEPLLHISMSSLASTAVIVGLLGGSAVLSLLRRRR